MSSPRQPGAEHRGGGGAGSKRLRFRSDVRRTPQINKLSNANPALVSQQFPSTLVREAEPNQGSGC
ncbi:hypothetical protein BST81_15910 [Leptolyngbya sp. 'hensonii']|uniref:hypothetical protein n=1 Tax=Leptolyngbya sp. 'hensonii' TaxID=1922337 RepID=UPI00094F5E5B|nr:hypothetical protein [Leptolyngbya sp. 'hensonii']OLP17299.1 hypothetical protein BST81_15910 [Leptolyngbya sp. 'hensonii']